MIPHVVPDIPWEKIGIDIFETPKGKYILAVDYYSKFVEMMLIPTTSLDPIVSFLKQIFTRHGIPKIVMSDNGPPFNKFGPNYINLCLLELMNTPISSTIPSPAQILYNRRLRTILPIKDSLLKPKLTSLSSLSKVRSQLELRQDKMKQYFDKTAKTLPDLREGEVVKVKNFNSRNWLDGVIVGKRDNYPRSYNVRVFQTNKIIRRNRIHLRSTKGQSQNTRQVYTNYDIPPTLVTHYGNTRTETLNPVNADNVDNKGNIQQTRSGRHIKAPDLREGEVVKVKNFNSRNWLDGVIVGKRDNYPRSYNGEVVKVKNFNSRNWLDGVIVGKRDNYPRSYNGHAFKMVDMSESKRKRDKIRRKVPEKKQNCQEESNNDSQ
ncbi:hypothetical protein QE152_g37925 [Popillia japonica]|uniref:Integrase catalytic domain-containing protein n=1 Tax=Popillia japonica TaxID=7064 RepID=A0AAW1I924_POPJA